MPARPDAKTPGQSQVIAAVDLGSNSFHLIVARVSEQRVDVLDKLKETVRLGAGLDKDRKFDDATVQRALDALARFGQRLRDLPAQHVRVVGTNAMRRAKNSGLLRDKGAKVLGHPIEVISGREEARLIYAGVLGSLPSQEKRQLVIDIGGGSTELIIGQGQTPIALESLFMGCVSFTERYFPDGMLTRSSWDAAVTAACQELEVLQQEYCAIGWDEAIGSSGTVIAIHDVIAKLWPENPGVNTDNLRRLSERLLDFEKVEAINLPGLSSDRNAVFPGGLAIASGVVKTLNVNQLGTSDAALREGLLADIYARLQHKDTRDTTVAEMQRRYSIDSAQAARVRECCDLLLNQIKNKWNLSDDNTQKILSWASQLHELGLYVSHSQYHKHGEYLLKHSDMRGFSREEQEMLAILVRNHRRKPTFKMSSELGDAEQRFVYLTILLRLSVVLNRSRLAQTLPELKISVQKDSLQLSFEKQWLETHPLTAADLKQEAAYLKNCNVELTYE